jgi:iron complex outermembrane receptor protein/outer membrane receptor for ferrienterochelin and colicins
VNGITTFTPFNPKDKCSATLLYHFASSWRAGYEVSTTAHQYVYNELQVNNYWFSALMVGKKTGDVDVVINCENLFNVRQSDFSPLVKGSLKQPVFAPVWGPLEGRVVNVSVAVSF